MAGKGIQETKSHTLLLFCVTCGNVRWQPKKDSSFPVFPMSPALPESWAGLEVGLCLLYGQLWQQCGLTLPLLLALLQDLQAD